MANLKAIHLAFFLVFFSSLNVFGQWAPVNSGTTNNLTGAYLLDSGTGFVVGDAGTILKTTDAGATWAPLISGTTTALHGVYLLNPNEGVAVGDGGLILRTTDGGAGWQSVASGVKDSLRSVFFSGVNGICGGDSQTILYSTDSGASWQIGQTGFFGGGFPGAHMLSPSIGFVAGQNSIFQPLVGNTTDGGVSWNFHAFYFDNNEGGCTDIRFLDVNMGVVSGIVFDGRGAIARTTDGGVNWSTLFFDQGLEGVDFPVTNASNIGFAVGWGGRILHTANAGVTWIEQTSGTSANLNDVSFVTDGLTGIAVGEGGIILRTTNGGGPGISINPSKDNTLYEYVPADGDRSNGVGDYFFAGKTAPRFDPAGRACLRHRGQHSAGLNDHKCEPEHAYVENTSRYCSDRRAAQAARRLGRRNIRRTGRGGGWSTGHHQRRYMAAPLLRHYFLGDTRRGLFQHGERKPVRGRHRRLHVEFGTDGRGCAVVAGQSGR